MAPRTLATTAVTPDTVALNAFIYGYAGNSVVTPQVSHVTMWWDEQRIDATVTREFVISNLQLKEQKLLDRPPAFGDGLTDGTYMEWILEKAKRIFLILRELGVTDQIRYIVDDSWDDDDLPLPLEAIERLKLTSSRDEALEKRFYKTQFKYLLRPMNEGDHKCYKPDEVVPVEPVNKRPGFTFEHTLEKVRLPRQPDVVFTRRRIVLGDSPGKMPEEEFLAEVQKMKTIVHQHIISLWASYTYEGCGYVLLTPASDVSLKSFIQFVPQQFRVLLKPQRRATLINWLHCLADGLAFLHRRGISHDDIKPSNIMIDESNNIFFADIGGFKAPDTEKKPYDIESYEYGPPEKWVRAATLHESSSPTLYSSPRIGLFKPPTPPPTSSGTSTSDKGSLSEQRLHSPTGSAAIVNEWRNNLRDPKKSDIFSLACVYLDILTFLMKKKSTSFSSHRSAKNKKAGRGGGLPDASYHANISQLESWIAILQKEASKKDDKIFCLIPQIMGIIRQMLCRNPDHRPEAREFEEQIYHLLNNTLEPGKPHCGIHQISDGNWDFGSSTRSSVRNSAMTDMTRSSGSTRSVSSTASTMRGRLPKTWDSTIYAGVELSFSSKYLAAEPPSSKYLAPAPSPKYLSTDPYSSKYLSGDSRWRVGAPRSRASAMTMMTS